MARVERRRYALADYSVERLDRGWYFGRQFDPTSGYRGPYASVASVTLSIARQLRREIERRDRRPNVEPPARQMRTDAVPG